MGELVERTAGLNVVRAGDLCELRLRAGMSRRELAEAAGVSEKTIYNAETGQRTPRRTTRHLIALALGQPEGAIWAGGLSPGTPDHL